MIDHAINKDHIRYNFFERVIRKIYRRDKYDPDILDRISQISFFDSVCSIDKFYLAKEEPFKDVVTGEVDLVAKGLLTRNISLRDRSREIDKTEKLFVG